MKVTLIGGGSARSPLFAASAFRRAARAGLDELCLMDIDPVRLKTISTLCCHLGKIAGSSVRITSTTDPESALEGASYLVTTIRVGNEIGRVYDEQIALKQGVLGQETTGPGGFAMAMRSIPAILEYAELAGRLCPDAWIFNFTNPAGLVTQALHRSGFHRVVGICDSANQAQHDVANWLDISPDSLYPEVFGLNHLSWTRRIWHSERDILPDLLADRDFCDKTSLKIFNHELIQALGLHLNEYLYYYYYSHQALEKIKAGEKTRGEEVLQRNRDLMDLLQKVDISQSPQEALRIYFTYEKQRSQTYMHFANPEYALKNQAVHMEFSKEMVLAEGGEGYAGVSLDVITALERSEYYHTALNTTNAGAIPGIADQDVVEVSCTISDGEITPLPVDEVPQVVRGLLYQVKAYENLAIDAIFSRSRRKAVLALMTHPLVLSYPKAEQLIDGYLKVHSPYIGEWSNS